MKIEVSNGELLDKVSILLIKEERISNPTKLKNVKTELEELLISAKLIKSKFDGIVNIEWFLKELIRINSILWDVEDRLRKAEAAQSFDLAFVSDARLVYQTNDERSKIKKDINMLTGSTVIEEKSYEKY
jgi:hypothetical protein